MNNDLIREAVEMAEGWEWNWGGAFCEAIQRSCLFGRTIGEPKQWHLDALAAQLWRQALEQGFDVHVDVQGSTFDAPGTWVEITDMLYSVTKRYEQDARDGHSMNLISAFMEFHNDQRPNRHPA